MEPPTDTPVIGEVTVGPVATPTVPGPYVPSGGTLASRVVNINALGTTEVPNPNYILGTTDPLTVTRHFDFGSHTPGDGGQVTINGIPVPEADIVAWGNLRIRVRIENTMAAGTSGQLMVRRGDNGKTTPIGITLTRGASGDVLDTTGTGTGNVHVVTPADPDVEPLATRIQDAIDAADPGDLIIVPASTWKYNENPILWKPLRLQGAGANTVLNANANPSERLTAWHERVALRLGGDPFTQDECSGVLVLGSAAFATTESRIDGFQITGSISGGGIGVFNLATGLRISNNRIIGNVGSTAGGIRIGQQGLPGELYDNANVTIAYNQVFKNAGELGAGGIGLYHGATGYKVVNNYIEGNVTRGNGAGIGHEGRNPGGLIANNVIAFNESFLDATPPGTTLVNADGGGIYIGGIPAAAGGLSDGSGSVTIINNLIQGNLAGVGEGGGIRAYGINGADVAGPGGQATWYQLDIFNNIIVNNGAGNSGGGISLQDAVKVRIINNAIARNDCTATALALFTGDTSTPRGGGLVSHQHSATLAGVLPGSQPNYCDPDLRNNILYGNQSYTFTLSTATLANAGNANQTDLIVEEIPAALLHPMNCILSDRPRNASYGVSDNNHIVGNTAADAQSLFVGPYNNNWFTAVVYDEAGNRVSVRSAGNNSGNVGIYTPGGVPRGDYHIQSASVANGAAANVGSIPELASDFDRDLRPNGGQNDIGADEYNGSTALLVSIVPPAAPAITVPQNGLAAVGDAPAITPVTGAGAPPGPAMAPLYFNPLPGDPSNPLLDKAPLVDSDGDGNPNNDVDYYNLTAGDGWATMADGTDLYTFGFSDQTKTVTDETAKAAGRSALADGVEFQANRLPGNNNTTRNNIKTQLLALAAPLPNGDPFKGPIITQANRLPGNNTPTRNDIKANLLALVPQIRAEIEPILRGIGPKVQTEGLLAANLSAPTMVFHEGRDAYLDLSNVGMLMRPDLFDPHTVHFHGFPQAASIFDGEPMASISIGMGGTLRYYYRIVEPGTYFYHCHVEATEHMQMGMIGNLWVLPKQNNLPEGTVLGGWVHHTGQKYAYNDGDGSTRYDVEAGLQVTGFDRNFHEQHIAVQPLPFAAMRDDYPLLNGRGYPDTTVVGDLSAPESNDYGRVSQKVSSLVTARAGQRILLRLSNVSEMDIHTLTVLGIPMRVIAKDARLLRGPTGRDLSYKTTSVKIGGGESADVILDTTGVAPGSYFFYATRLNHLSNDTQDYGGLMTEIVITAP